MKALKYSCVALTALLILIMGVATVLEKYRGSAFVSSAIYSSVWFVALWTLLAVASTVYLLRRRLQRRPVTFMIHASLLVILLGAGITWLTGKEGTLHLRGGEPATSFTDKSGEEIPLSAEISFTSFETICYPGTDTPKSFQCHLSISGDTLSEATIALNHVLSHNGVRYFLTSFDDDGEGVTLSVSKNSLGMGISYTGYALLMLSMAIFMFSRNTRFSSLRRSKATAAIAMTIIMPAAATAAPRSVNGEVAEALGRLHVYYNGRICPVNTMARDITMQLYGSRSYEGYDADRVLAGWLFFPSEWITTVDDSTPDKRQAVEMLISTDLMKIFPYEAEGIRWASPVTRVESSVDADRRIFMRRALDYISERIISGNSRDAIEAIGKIGQYQVKTAGDTLPSTLRFKAELLYNRMPLSLPLAIFCFLAGIAAYISYCRTLITGHGSRRCVSIVTGTAIAAALAILTVMLALRGYIASHLPMSNGFETMQCMAWCALTGALVAGRRAAAARPFGLIVAAMALMVAMMGEKNPAVTYMPPVLDSPWLCIHVMLVMISYSLLAFVMLGGMTGLLMLWRGHTGSSTAMASIGNRMLYPAVFTLAAGIFIGAIWANETWGRFWGWDPKEVWALITMLIYAFPLHSGFKWYADGAKRFHIYAVAAFICVAITYFGVNFFLGGLHSYA